MIYTSYLAKLKQHPEWVTRFGNRIYFVMIGRGNNAVAPTLEMLTKYKVSKDWEGYEKEYVRRLQDSNAFSWMGRIAHIAHKEDVLLVCYEKSNEQCHRRLLAEEIQHLFDVPYMGELE